MARRRYRRRRSYTPAVRGGGWFVAAIITLVFGLWPISIVLLIAGLIVRSTSARQRHEYIRDEEEGTRGLARQIESERSDRQHQELMWAIAGGRPQAVALPPELPGPAIQAPVRTRIRR